MAHDLSRITKQFKISGELIEAAPYGTGHINDTYCAKFSDAATLKPYIIQRINHNVFKDVPKLMENIERVTAHVASKIKDNEEELSLTLIKTHENHSYYVDDEGNYWRVYIFIEGAKTYDIVESPHQAYEAAKAYGLFQKQLCDLAGPRLHDTIADFHNTPKRFDAFEKALSADACNLAAKIPAEIDFAMAHKKLTGLLIDLHQKGEMPERVTHNDTKINNVMLDNNSGKGVCVIDLDTVMPGLALYDFGDAVRTGTCIGKEDEQDLNCVKFSLELFEAMARGYLNSAADFLTAAEVQHLAFSAKLITFEIGIRFLTDYLEGDVYFKTHRPGHNLDRARVQFELVRQMEAQQGLMETIVAGVGD